MWFRLFSPCLLAASSGPIAPSKEAILKLIQRSAGRRSGPRRGWQVKAASWVKRAHIDRGDKKVGLFSTDGKFHIIEDLRPKYIVPDFTNSLLRPYVSHYKSAPAGKSS